jgi:hypothetical protein
MGAKRKRIEAVNSVIRKVTRNRKICPNEESAVKLVFMAIREAAKKWTMPIHHWKEALYFARPIVRHFSSGGKFVTLRSAQCINHFAIMFKNRMPQLNGE